MPYQGRLPYTYKSPYNYTLDQGTQTVPSLAFLGDTNNGLFSPATDNVAITTNGVERLRVTSDGNIGIGTTNPNTFGYGGSVLGLYGASNLGGNIWLTSDATTAGNRAGRIGFGLEQNGSDKEIARIWALSEGTATGNLGGRLVFNTKSDGVGGASVERVRITSTGNVGIGTTNPGTKLHVYQASGDGVVRLTTAFGSGTEYDLTVGGNGNYSPGVFAIRYNTGGTTPFIIEPTGHVTPGADATQNLGSSTKRWANIYSADLQLSNEGSSNDVDGTWGQYTIQEGEDDLFLLNRRNGKKYKFVLQEVN